MRRHPRDPTVPTYLPPWPTTWPDTPAEARRVVENMPPHAAARRFALSIVVILAAGAALVAFLTLPFLGALPLVVSVVAGVVGAYAQARRRGAPARRRRNRREKP